MKYLGIILEILSFVLNLFKPKGYNKITEKEKEVIVKSAESKDVSDVTSGFDRVNRLR